MMITRRESVPWSWVLFASFPFAVMIFAGAIPGMGFTFTLKKFVDNPALITFILSVGLPITMVVGPTVNYLSDRIWTRFGRRKIFMVASSLVSAAAILAMPFAPTLPLLIVCLVLFSLGGALGTTTQPLSNEIIPIPQRGRASSLQYIILTAGNIVFYTFLIGRFDDVRFVGPLARLLNPMTGEVLLYAVYALIVLALMMMTILGIKEMLPPDRKTMDDVRVNGRFSLRKYLRFFFVDVFDRQWLALYMLLFANAMYSLGLGSMTPLLYTEQWGYSKQEMGMNVAIGAVILIPFAAAAGWFLDKFSKMKLYQACIVLIATLKLFYWVFVQFVLPDHRPALWQIIVFGEMMAIVGTLSGIAMMPLYFEYVPRNKMGTAAAGMSLMNNVFGFLAANLTGLWVTAYSHLFCPHAGYEVRVILQQPTDRPGLMRQLRAGDVTWPQRGVYCEPLFPPGEGGSAGRHWMIRMEDAAGARADQDRKRRELSRQADERELRDARDRGGDTADLEARLARDESDIARIDAEQQQAAETTRARVQNILSGRLVSAAHALGAVEPGHALLVEIPTGRGMTKQDIDRLDSLTRDRLPALVELMPLRALDPNGHAQGIAAVLEPESASPTGDVAVLCNSIRAVVAAGDRRLQFGLEPLAKADPAVARVRLVIPLWRVNVRLVDAVNARNAETIMKSLRLPGQRAARIDPLSDGARMRVAALRMPPAGSPSPAPQAAALAAAGVSDPDAVEFLSGALDLFIATADGLRLAVERPFTASRYAPQRYDYFSGYIFMFLTDILALYVTFVIIRLERKGVVRKLGIEEHEQHA